MYTVVLHAQSAGLQHHQGCGGQAPGTVCIQSSNFEKSLKNALTSVGNVEATYI